MNGWMIFAAVLLVLFLIGQIRVGARAEYSAAGFAAWVRLGPAELRVLPGRKKGEKPPKGKQAESSRPKAPGKPGRSPEPGGPAPEKPGQSSKSKKPEKAEQPLAEKVGGAVDYALALLPVALDAAAQFTRKLRIDHLRVELTAGAEDPADAALRYGQAVAALGAIWGPLTRAFQVKDGEARALVDFGAVGMTVYGGAALSLKIGQIVRLGLWAGWRALWAFLRVRKAHKQEKKKNFSMKV